MIPLFQLCGLVYYSGRSKINYSIYGVNEIENNKSREMENFAIIFFLGKY